MTIPTSFDFLLKRSQSRHLDPERDWLLLLIGGVIVLSGIIVWNVWAFNIVASGGVIGKTATSATPVFNQTSLDELHTLFASRAAEEEKYVQDVYEYPDPSQEEVK